MNDFDFSHLNTQNNQNKSNGFDFSHLNSNSQSPEMVDTLFGKLPANAPEQFRKETTSPDYISQMVNAAGSTPALKVIGEGVGLGAQTLKNAFKSVSPLAKVAREAKNKYENIQNEEEQEKAQGQVTGLPREENAARLKINQNQNRLDELYKSLEEKPINLIEQQEFPSVLKSLYKKDQKGNFIHDNNYINREGALSHNQVENELSVFERGSLKPELWNVPKKPSNDIASIDLNTIPKEGQQNANDINKVFSELFRIHKPWEIRRAIENPGKNPDIDPYISFIQKSEQKINSLLPKTTIQERSLSNLENAKKTHEEAKNLVNETEKSLGSHLNRGIDYDVRAGERIHNIEKANRQQIGQGYQNLEEDWANRNVELDNAALIQEKNKELMGLIKSGESRTPEAKNVLDELERLEKEKSVSAKDYLRTYRSVSQFAREARQKAYQPGMNAEERAEWKQKYNDLDTKVDEMGKVLEESVGGNEFSKLKELNDRWRTEVVPLHKSPVYQKIAKENTISDNIIKTLRGNDKAKVIIRNIIKKDPELLRTVVGQRYAIKPTEVLNPEERLREYTDLMPELKQLREQHLSSKNSVEEAKKAAEEARTTHEEITSNAEKYSKNKQEIDEIQNNLSVLDRHVENLRQIASRKNLSLKEKIKSEKEYKNALIAQRNARRRLKYLGWAGLGATGIGGTYYLGKALTSGLENIKQGEDE